MKVFQLLAPVILAVAGVSAQAAPLKVFTDRPVDRLERAMRGFTSKTGIQVEIVSAPYAELKAKIDAGQKADVLLLKDLSTMTAAARANVFTAMNSANRSANIASFMRDSQGRWTALTYRVRTLVYDSSVFDERSMNSYESIAGRSFSGQLCIRNAKEYMPSMVAWMIERYGEAKTKDILAGWKANLAAGFTDNDTQTLKNIESGTCTAGISNHYYLARLKNADSRFPVEIAFANQNEGGVHTNGFGGGLVAGTTRSSEGNSLMAYLMTPEGQQSLIVDPSFEYPAVQNLQPVQIVRNFGTFSKSQISWTEVGANMSKANDLLERVGWAR